jgi:hypothetical protein
VKDLVLTSTELFQSFFAISVRRRHQGRKELALIRRCIAASRPMPRQCRDSAKTMRRDDPSMEASKAA